MFSNAKLNPKNGNWFMVILMVWSIPLPYIFSKIKFWMEFYTGGGYNTATAIILGEFLLFMIPLSIYCFIFHDKIHQIIPMRKIEMKNVIYVVVFSLSMQPLTKLISGISSMFFQNHIEAAANAITDYPLSIGILAMALTPAIAEELVFRGVILSNYKDIPIKKAAIINGLFFGMMHGNLQQFFYAFILGVFFAYFVRYTGCILFSCIGHFVINASQMLQLFSLKELAKGMGMTLDEYMKNARTAGPTVLSSNDYITIFLMILVLVISTAIAIYTFRKFIAYNKDKIDLPKEVESESGEIEKSPKVFRASLLVIILLYVFIIIKNQ